MTLRRRARCLIAVVLLVVCTEVRPWEWPVPEGRVVTVFGAPEGGTLGIQIADSTRDVAAAEDGEVVFAVDDGSCSQCLPSVLGSFVVVHHDRGFRTIYGHLREIAEAARSDGATASTGNEHTVSSGSPIGVLGQSGAALGMRLYLQIIDSRRGVSVNPLLLLPALPDEEAPVIRAIELEPVPAEPSSRRVVVSATDRFDGSVVLPYGFALLIDGQLEREIVLDTLRIDERSGQITTSDGSSVEDIIRRDGSVDLGVHSIVSGVSEVEIVVRDQSGNRTVRQFRPAAEP